jgi:hypothetical protein
MGPRPLLVWAQMQETTAAAAVTVVVCVPGRQHQRQAEHLLAVAVRLLHVLLRCFYPCRRCVLVYWRRQKKHMAVACALATPCCHSCYCQPLLLRAQRCCYCCCWSAAPPVAAGVEAAAAALLRLLRQLHVNGCP